MPSFFRRGFRLRISPRVFLVASAAVTLPWLLFAAPWLSVRGGGDPRLFTSGIGNQDFAQYYMGAVMAREGAWRDLYPLPNEPVTGSVSWPQHSRMRPRYATLARESGLTAGFRYVHPPPMALFLRPLAALEYGPALFVWTGLMGLCCWGLGLLAAGFYVRLRGAYDAGAGLLVLLCGFSPLVLKTLRTGNISPLTALAVGVAAWGLVARAPGRAAAGTVASGLFKGVGALFVPLLLLFREWRALAWTGVLVLGVNAAALAVMGAEPYRVFFAEVAPTLGLPDAYIGNQSLAGFLLRARDAEMLPARDLAMLRLGGAAVLVLLYFGAWRWRSGAGGDGRAGLAPDAVGRMGVLSALVATMLIFAPYAWEHYALYFFPFWGWLAWEAARGGPRRWLALAAIALVWCPFAALREGTLPLPGLLRPHMLYGFMLMLGLGISRFRALRV